MRLTALPAFEDNYIWALVDDEGNAVIVDPGDAAPVLAATELGMWPAGIQLTHHHPDHCGGVAALRQRWPTLPVFAPEDERITQATQRVGEGSRLQLNGWDFEVIAVPGHTLSHVAYHGEGGHLTERRDGPPAEDDDADQAAHAQLIVVDQVDAHHDRDHGGDLLHGGGEIGH